YWLGILDFALSIRAYDSYFNYYRNQLAELAAEDKPIVNLAEEEKLNIFIRAMSDKALFKALPDYSEGLEMFVKLRKLKNNF
ncbi:hydroxyacylglutathione hydrolase C-terminal domain-containing protein, partial [Francisella tularensis]|uniref:hydroxyacylglutathione hydrolase C-terminal domain-containing protein n=1 Tax=Francisella tularensis TaxID=263 RepID=UPI002381A734